MGLFGSLKKDAEEAAAKVSAQFPGSRLEVQVNDKIVTLSGTAPDVVTKRQIMEAFQKLVPDAENVINSIRPEKAGTAPAAAPAPAPVSAGSPLPGPAAAPAAPAAQAGPRVHEVKKGETLSAIAKTYYGNAGKYMKIFEANKDVLKDPDKIFPGQKLRIPD